MASCNRILLSVLTDHSPDLCGVFRWLRLWADDKTVAAAYAYLDLLGLHAPEDHMTSPLVCFPIPSVDGGFGLTTKRLLVVLFHSAFGLCFNEQSSGLCVACSVNSGFGLTIKWLPIHAGPCWFFTRRTTT